MYENPFMCIALKQAMNSKEEIPVGAVIVYKGSVIAQSHNSVKKNFDPTAHAEILCIRETAKILRTSHLNKCDIYVTLEPCAMCAQAISLSRIKRLYFGAYDPKFGAIENGVRLFNSKNANHVPEIYGGIEEKKSIKILKSFFKKIRNDKAKILPLIK